MTTFVDVVTTSAVSEIDVYYISTTIVLTQTNIVTFTAIEFETETDLAFTTSTTLASSTISSTEIDTLSTTRYTATSTCFLRCHWRQSFVRSQTVLIMPTETLTGSSVA